MSAIIEHTWRGPVEYPDAFSFAKSCLTYNGAGDPVELSDVANVLARLLSLLTDEGKLTIPQLATILGAEIDT